MRFGDFWWIPSLSSQKQIASRREVGEMLDGAARSSILGIQLFNRWPTERTLNCEPRDVAPWSPSQAGVGRAPHGNHFDCD